MLLGVYTLLSLNLVAATIAPSSTLTTGVRMLNLTPFWTADINLDFAGDDGYLLIAFIVFDDA